MAIKVYFLSFLTPFFIYSFAPCFSGHGKGNALVAQHNGQRWGGCYPRPLTAQTSKN